MGTLAWLTLTIALVVLLIKVVATHARKEERYEREIAYLTNQVRAIEQARAIHRSLDDSSDDTRRLYEHFERD